MKNVERRANLLLVVMLVILPVTFAILFTVISGDVFTGTSRVVAGAITLIVVSALGGIGTLRQARQFGSLSQLTAFRRAIRKNGKLPADADAVVWRPQLELAQAFQRPIRQRVLWLWFGVTMSLTQSITDGTDGPLALVILAVVGSVIGLGVGQVLVKISARLRRNIQSLLEQIDDRQTGAPA